MTNRLLRALSTTIVLGLLAWSPDSARAQTVKPNDINWDAQMPMRLCVLHSFDNQCGPPFPHLNCRPLVQDGVSGVRVGAIVQGPPGDENFYGASPAGGKYNAGTVFQLTPQGDLTVLYNFGEAGMTDGAYPSGGLTLGNDKYLYGATYVGGDNNLGTIYKMARAVGTPEILYSFRGGQPDPQQKGQALSPQQIDDLAAAYPLSAPILGPDGNVYGVTPTSNPAGGVLYRLTGRDLHCLHRFKSTEAGTYGLSPSTLTLGSDGSFYGTTRGDDRARFETVFQFSAGAAGNITTIYNFKPGDGAIPNGVIQGYDGNLYGTTYSGGPFARGVVFRLTPGLHQYKILHAFGGNASNPVASLVQVLQHDINFNTDPKAPVTESYDAYLYGAAVMNHSLATDGPTGILFRVRPDGSDFSTVYNTDMRTGAGPQVTPVLARDSTPGGPNLYGIMAGGGTYSAGVFYRLNTAPLVVEPETNSTTDLTKLIFQGSSQGNTWIYDTPLVPLVEVATYMTAYLPGFATKGHINGITVRVRNQDAKIVQFFYRERFDKNGQPASGLLEQYDPGHTYGPGDVARFNNFLWLSTIPGNQNHTPPTDPTCEKLKTCGGFWLPAYQMKGKYGFVPLGLCGLLDECTLVPPCDKNNPYAPGSYECVPLATWGVDAQGRKPGPDGLTNSFYLPTDTQVDCDGYTLYDSPTVATADEDWKFSALDYVIMHRAVVATVTWTTEMKPNVPNPSFNVSINGPPGPRACIFKKLLANNKFEQPFDLPFACPK